MPVKPDLSHECIEQLDTWVRVHWPNGDAPDGFMPGLWVIVEDEVIRAPDRERAHFRARFLTSNSQ